jgi:hypothetical protein
MKLVIAVTYFFFLPICGLDGIFNERPEKGCVGRAGSAAKQGSSSALHMLAIPARLRGEDWRLLFSQSSNENPHFNGTLNKSFVKAKE